MNIALFAIAALTAIGALLTIGSVGKQRKPTTPGIAAFTVAISAAEVVVLVYAALHYAA